MADKEDRTYRIDIGVTVNGGELSEEGLPTPQEKHDAEKGKQTNVPGKTKSKNVSKGDMALGIAKQQGKKAAMAVLSNYGNITGDYLTQSNLQSAVSIGETLFGIGVATAAGGVAGLVTSVVGTAVSFAANTWNFYGQKARDDKNARWLAQRVGYAAFK